MASRIRIHRPVGKSHVPIVHSSLVAKQQKKQPTNAPKLDCPDPKFNFDLSKIPVSSPHRSSQPSPKINPKLGDNKSSEKERENESKNSETTIQTFTTSPPGKPQEADETKTQLQQPELRAKSEPQQKKADVFAEIKRLSRYNFDLTKIPISVPNRPPVQSKQNVDISFSRRVQQPIKRDRLSTKEDNSQELTAPSTASSDLESSIQQTKGGGNPLEDKVREPMEQAFGADFSGVRIHTDSSAVGMNQELGAQAFTHGNDIYFNDGKFTPQSSEGKHLLAHELTHTVQQGASIQRKVNIFTGLSPTIQLLPGFIKRGVNWLAERTIPGYTLLNVVLGKNLITGAAVARSGVNLIKGYMRLSPVTGSILLSELEETESLPQAGKWVEGQVAKFGIDFNDIARRLKLMWDEMSGWKGIDWNIKVFKKHLGPVIGKVMAFSSVVMEKVKELRFEGALRLVGATELLNALKQDPKAFKKAVDNPKDVLKQFMTGALKKGFANFKDNFVTHFKNALLGWLFGKAAEMGVQMPKEFSVAGIFSLVAQLVGATYQQIRKTVVKRLGAKGEKIVSKLETAVSFIKNLVTKGPVALWEMVASSLSNLKEMLFSQIATLVSTEIIKAAVTKLLSMLNPAGAIVQLALTLYRVIKFFIDNWETIKSVALGILNSIAMVALNKVGAAASFVEKVMAQGMKLIIAFLARIFGLGGIVGKVKALIKKLSNPVKKAIAKVIDWIVAKGKKLFGRGKAGKGKKEKEGKFTQRDRNVGLAAFEKEEKPFVQNGGITQEDARKVGKIVKNKHPVFKSITVVDGKDSWNYKYIFRYKNEVDTTTNKAPNELKNGVPERRYLPSRVNVRRHLYINGSGFGSAAKEVKNETLEKLREDIRRMRNLPLESPQRNTIWKKWVRKELVPADADRDKYTVAKINAAKYDVDHIKPLARHWKESGFNSTDKARQTIAGSKKNLRLVLMSINRSKGAEGHYYSDKPYVGSNFSSDYNNCPKKAKRLLGQYFRDNNGKALK